MQPKKFNLLLFVGLSFSLIPLVAPLPAHAQEAAPMPRFGTIDLGKVMNSSKKRYQAGLDLQRMQRTNDSIKKKVIQTGMYMLPVAEFHALADLYQITKTTPAQQKQIDTLEAKGDQLRRELTNLQNVASPTAAQSARLTELIEAQTKGGENFKVLQKTLNDHLNSKEEELDRATRTQVQEAVAKVAKAKKLSVVFAGDGVIYNSVDVTEDVVKEVSK